MSMISKIPQSQTADKFVETVGVDYCALGQSECRKETVTLLQDIKIKLAHGQTLIRIEIA